MVGSVGPIAYQKDDIYCISATVNNTGKVLTLQFNGSVQLVSTAGATTSSGSGVPTGLSFSVISSSNFGTWSVSGVNLICNLSSPLAIGVSGGTVTNTANTSPKLCSTGKTPVDYFSIAITNNSTVSVPTVSSVYVDTTGLVMYLYWNESIQIKNTSGTSISSGSGSLSGFSFTVLSISSWSVSGTYIKFTLSSSKPIYKGASAGYVTYSPSSSTYKVVSSSGGEAASFSSKLIDNNSQLEEPIWVIGGVNAAWYSSSGTSWTRVSLSYTISRMVYDGQRFIGIVGSNNIYLYSSSGDSWSSGTLSSGSSFSGIATNGSGTVCIVDYFEKYFWYTGYSLSWYSGTMTGGYLWTDVTYGNGYWVLVGSIRTDSRLVVGILYNSTLGGTLIGQIIYDVSGGYRTSNFNVGSACYVSPYFVIFLQGYWSATVTAISSIYLYTSISGLGDWWKYSASTSLSNTGTGTYSPFSAVGRSTVLVQNESTSIPGLLVGTSISSASFTQVASFNGMTGRGLGYSSSQGKWLGVWNGVIYSSYNGTTWSNTGISVDSRAIVAKK
jgi:hypothetical protein